MTTQVNVYEAKTQLSALLTQVEKGEDVIIARHGRPVAKIIPFTDKPIRRQPGYWKGKVWMADDFDEMDEEQLREWYEVPVFPEQ
jgi:prevent-host-death family protein